VKQKNYREEYDKGKEIEDHLGRNPAFFHFRTLEILRLFRSTFRTNWSQFAGSIFSFPILFEHKIWANLVQIETQYNWHGQRFAMECIVWRLQ
jgi:hypothetical protein